jgi:hypothetical protein
MTNLEALQSTVSGYQLATNVFTRILTDRAITSTDTYIGTSQAFQLATADVYIAVATMVNVSEGGFSVSVNDRENLISMANSIYQRYGKPLYGKAMAKVKAVSPW